MLKSHQLFCYIFYRLLCISNVLENTLLQLIVFTLGQSTFFKDTNTFSDCSKRVVRIVNRLTGEDSTALGLEYIGLASVFLYP